MAFILSIFALLTMVMAQYFIDPLTIEKCCLDMPLKTYCKRGCFLQSVRLSEQFQEMLISQKISRFNVLKTCLTFYVCPEKVHRDIPMPLLQFYL